MHPCVRARVRALLLLLSAFVVCASSKSAPVRRHRNEFVKSESADSGPRIIGGHVAAEGEFPYQVSVRSDKRTAYHGHFCGGAIIDATTVVTAAHCVHNLPTAGIGDLYIVAGSNSLSSGGTKVYVKETLVHPDYGPVYQDYDIALLYLQEPLPLNNRTISAISLQDVEGLPSGVSCVTSGWGRTKDTTNGPLPDMLQGVDVPIINFETCARYYMEETEYSPIIETQICAGYEEGKKDACQGDSGGPLVCNGLLTGIVSWGMGCAVARFPGVYSDVAFLLPWIEENAKVVTGTTTTTTVPSTNTSAAPATLASAGPASLALLALLAASTLSSF